MEKTCEIRKIINPYELVDIFYSFIIENNIYNKYQKKLRESKNETRQECIYLKKIPYNTARYIMQRLNEEEEGATAIIRLTIDWFNLVYNLDMWRLAASRLVSYCSLHHIE